VRHANGVCALRGKSGKQELLTQREVELSATSSSEQINTSPPLGLQLTRLYYAKMRSSEVTISTGGVTIFAGGVTIPAGGNTGTLDYIAAFLHMY
jgi:hypothetical protein